jgi:hypothetical protein
MAIQKAKETLNMLASNLYEVMEIGDLDIILHIVRAF